MGEINDKPGFFKGGGSGGGWVSVVGDEVLLVNFQ